MRHSMEQAVLELIAKRAQALGVVREGLASNFRGFAQADDACDIFRARAHTTLVVSAVKKLLQASSATHIERADTLGRVQLVAGKREQIELERIHVDRNFSG